MCQSVHACVHIYMHVHVCIYMCQSVHVCIYIACMCIYVHVCACVHMHVRVCACTCIYVHVCANMCTYMCQSWQGFIFSRRRTFHEIDLHKNVIDMMLNTYFNKHAKLKYFLKMQL